MAFRSLPSTPTGPARPQHPPFYSHQQNQQPSASAAKSPQSHPPQPPPLLPNPGSAQSQPPWLPPVPLLPNDKVVVSGLWLRLATVMIHHAGIPFQVPPSWQNLTDATDHQTFQMDYGTHMALQAIITQPPAKCQHSSTIQATLADAKSTLPTVLPTEVSAGQETTVAPSQFQASISELNPQNKSRRDDAMKKASIDLNRMMIFLSKSKLVRASDIFSKLFDQLPRDIILKENACLKAKRIAGVVQHAMKKYLKDIEILCYAPLKAVNESNVTSDYISRADRLLTTTLSKLQNIPRVYWMF